MRHPGLYDANVQPVLDGGQTLLEKLCPDSAPAVVRMHGEPAELSDQIRVGSHFENDRRRTHDAFFVHVLGDEHQRLVGEDQLLDLEFFVVLRVGVVLTVRGQVDVDDPAGIRITRLPNGDQRTLPSWAGSPFPAAIALPPWRATSASHAAPEASTFSSISNRLEWAG